MDEMNNQAIPMPEDDEPILPEGWAENDDIFGDTWASDSTEEPAPAATEEDTGEQSEGATPTSDSDETAQGEQPAEETAPASETAPDEHTPTKFRFPTTLDHQTVEVEVGEDEIEEIYQKAYATDRMKRRLEQAEPILNRVNQVAKQMGYDSADEWITAATQSRVDQETEKLIQEGVHPEVAAYLASQRVGVTAEPVAPKQEVPAQTTAPSRDFQAEVEELYRVRPETRESPLPPEVVRECVRGGKPLLYAYMDYTQNQTALTAANEHEELVKLRAQLAIEKQNSAAAVQAPVRGVSGGGATETKPIDDFERGFDMDDEDWS